ncbi:uncharacterized protein J4E79_004184 [Alternaria viburni]|uniref:uncharacterized protein n=1 Tax=Alternaria viburni TaxID=566460 RepID=UPI0020C51A8A|nr:uncharacterized protein J4E79_004184 [Alternaria viburni]KAI4662873.1 hypothetical protein J4E79_004184 [Alternaria viburni]
MTAHAASTAREAQASKATGVPRARPAHEEVEYDSEAETLVETRHEAARRLPANEPCTSSQGDMNAAVRAQKAKEMENAVQRSESLIGGAGRKA